MKMGCGFGKRDEQQSARRAEMIRFLASAIGLWAACATAVYLIGPGEPEAAPGGMVASAMAAAQANPSAMAYRR